MVERKTGMDNKYVFIIFILNSRKIKYDYMTKRTNNQEKERTGPTGKIVLKKEKTD